MIKVSAPKDLWAGLIYLGFGVAGLWFGATYPMGSAGKMGSGYFPKVLATALIAFGLVGIVRSLVLNGSPITRVHVKPLVLILVACSLFGLLLEPLGMVIALFVLVMASRDFALDAKSLLGALGLIAACALVFVKGLGVQMPLVGAWLEPFTAGIPWLR
jgi:Tripartite tricarboxylate transporter TctB family